MAFSITYKRLFSIRLLHGFYMKDNTGFWNASAVQQARQLEDWSYHILNDIEIEPTVNCRTLLDGQRMKFQPTLSGFSVWINVVPEQTGSIIKYKPFIPVDPGIEFTFRIKARNSFFNNISNVRLRPNVEAEFYFSNDNTAGQLAYPSLALSPPLHDNGRAYEMGEKVANGAGNVFVAPHGLDGTVPLNTGNWATGTTFQYFSYRDQLLLPRRFRYYFTPNGSTMVANPTFILKTMANAVLDTKTVSGTFQHSSSCKLDYSGFSDGFYQIEVNATGYQDLKTIYLHDELYDPYDWGVIHVKHRDNLNDFRLLEQDGALRMNNNTLEEPVFDVRMDSRSTYWKYILHPLNIANLSNINTAIYQIITPDTFISLVPRNLNKFQTSQTAGQNSSALPLPYNGTIQPVNGKVYSEIFLPKMNL